MAFTKKKPEVESEETGSEPVAKPKKSKASKPDGKDLLELVGKVQQKRDAKRKKPKEALPPQLSKEPKQPE